MLPSNHSSATSFTKRIIISEYDQENCNQGIEVVLPYWVYDEQVGQGEITFELFAPWVKLVREPEFSFFQKKIIMIITIGKNEPAAKNTIKVKSDYLKTGCYSIEVTVPFLKDQKSVEYSLERDTHSVGVRIRKKSKKIGGTVINSSVKSFICLSN